MKKVYDLAVKVGSYTDREGNNKNRYENVGSIMESDNGQFIILNRTFNPAGVPNPDNKSSVIISMFAAKEKEGNSIGTPVNLPADENPFSDSDIPF